MCLSIGLSKDEARNAKPHPFPARLRVCGTRFLLAQLTPLHPACWDAGQSGNDVGVRLAHARFLP
jgi:hypothetical protein